MAGDINLQKLKQVAEYYYMNNNTKRSRWFTTKKPIPSPKCMRRVEDFLLEHIDMNMDQEYLDYIGVDYTPELE